MILHDRSGAGLVSRLSRRVLFFFSSAVLLPLLFAGFATGAGAAGGRPIELGHVIDGDTIITKDGEHIRYIGIDAPEIGQPLSYRATETNRALLRSGPLRIVECRAQRRDRYGRTLAWVYAGGRLVNGELLRRGLARPLFIPPCGAEKRALMERFAWEARTQGRGIWKSSSQSALGAVIVSPEEAGAYIGTTVSVRGRVREVYENPGVVIIEFALENGSSTGFKAVIFPDALPYFRGAGMEPRSFSGRVITVTGVPRLYRGDVEIILMDPGQVRIVGER